MAWFNKKTKAKEKDGEKPIYVGQIAQIPSSDQDIRIDKNKAGDILTKLLQITDKYEAIDFIVDNTPDGKAALNIYLRLINQGLHVTLYDRDTGIEVKDYDVMLRDFCANKLGGTSDGGLDSFMEQLYTSSILHGGMAVEVVVGKGATEIEDVLIIDPKTIVEWEYLPNEHRYAAYQQTSGGQKIDLFQGNFFWIPHQPKPGRPDGTLQFEAAIPTMTQYYKTLEGCDVYLTRLGIPKLDIAIDIEKALKSAPPEVLSNQKKKEEYLANAYNSIVSGVRKVERDSSFVHYTDIEIGLVGGGMGGTGLDVRAWNDLFTPLIANAFNLTPVTMGRLDKGSYSLGSAEYKISKDTMETYRRDGKRMIENVINIWARTQGLNVYAIVEHNPIEWQVEKEKHEAELLQIEKARRVEEYGYVSAETAATMAIGRDADPQPKNPDLYEYIKKEFVENGEATEETESKEEKKPDETETKE